LGVKSVLSELQHGTSASTLNAVLTENRQLREQAMKLKGEILRLESQIDDIRRSAVDAAQQSVQVLRGIRERDEDSYDTSSVDVVIDLTKHNNVYSTHSSKFSPSREVKSSNDVMTSQDLNDSNFQKDNKISVISQDALADALSPVVEERLLRTIYSKYVSENSTTMSLSRFGRFAREFGITSSGPGAGDPPYLVTGEIDVIFMNSIKSPTADSTSNDTSTRPFSVKYAGNCLSDAPTVYSIVKYAKLTCHASNHLSVAQFILAIELLAVKLYANLIERQTGASLECLPVRQRQIATRAATEVFLKKKILPKALPDLKISEVPIAFHQ
jgi:hypothetical protein